MRHYKIGRYLNRNSSHRVSLLRNLSISLIFYEIIKTTVPKAKELKRTIEPLITLSKLDNLARRRLVFSKIRNIESVKKLFNTLGPRFLTRKGGYTRILRCGFRSGDYAPMAYISLISEDDQK